MQGKYLNPYTDFGFKKLFGEEGSKDLLIDFLNQLLPPQHQIAQLRFKNTENLPNTESERKAIFDIYCESVSGEHFIVEMQKAKMHWFKDRALFYLTFPIRDQAEKGDWNFKLSAIYLVAILDFEYDEKEERRKLRRDVELKDQDGDVFYDKRHLKFIQMPLFNKEEHELDNHFDKWLYFLKKLPTFDHIPQILNEPVFQKGFKLTEISNLTPEQYEFYQKSLLQYWDIKNVVDTAFGEGIEQGIGKGALNKALEIADTMLAKGLPLSLIMEITGLTEIQLQPK